MTEQPPSGDDTAENPFAPPGDDELNDPWHDHIVEVTDTFGAPEVQSLVAFVLSLLSMTGIGLFNGATYLFTTLGAETTYRARNITAALLGAAFALVPVVLGWRVSARILDTDSRWAATLARAAVILGLLALVLRLVIAVIAASQTEPRANFNTF